MLNFFSFLLKFFIYIFCILLPVLILSIKYGYLTHFIVLLSISLLYDFSCNYDRWLLNILKVTKAILIVLFIITILQAIVLYLINAYPTETWGEIALSVLIHILLMLFVIFIFTYGECGEIFNKIVGKISPITRNRFKIFIWCVFVTTHIMYIISLIFFANATQLDYIILLIASLLLLENYNSNNKK